MGIILVLFTGIHLKMDWYNRKGSENSTFAPTSVHDYTVMHHLWHITAAKCLYQLQLIVPF
jgi:hypothetical protein